MNETVGNSVLFGRFYPEYDIAVSLLWVFIILGGVGNWVVMWCILKTKSLRNPFNMLVLALALVNAISTTALGPMNLVRTLMAHNQVNVHWCNARVLLKTFCFSVSIMIIFTLAAMRLTAGLKTMPKKPTYKTITAIIVIIYCFAVITAPIFLDKTTATYRSCFGNVNEDSLKIILQNEGILPTEETDLDASFENQPLNESQYGNHSTSTWLALTEAMIESTSVSPNFTNMTISNDDMAADNDKTAEFWMYYLVMTFALFIGTVVCYIGLIIVLKRRKNKIKSMTLGNSKDILTMRVTAYVTCTFFISFLVPFFPGLVTVYPQRTAARFHYIAVFHCLAYLDGALTPIIYYFSNPAYRNVLCKALPQWIRKCCCGNAQITPAPSSVPSTNSGVIMVASANFPVSTIGSQE